MKQSIEDHDEHLKILRAKMLQNMEFERKAKEKEEQKKEAREEKQLEILKEIMKNSKKFAF